MNIKVSLLTTKRLGNSVSGMLSATDFALTTIPFIAIKKLAEKEKIEAYSGLPATAIFTSQNAVETVFSFSPDASRWKIFSLDGKTKNTLLKYVGEEQILATALDGKALSDKIISQPIPEKIIFFCGKKRLQTIPEALSDKHIRLEEVIVYDTVASPVKLTQQFGGILFFSPSAVESFFSVNAVSEKTIFFSIGATTEKAIKKLTGNEIVTAQYPSEAEMVRNVIKYRFPL